MVHQALFLLCLLNESLEPGRRRERSQTKALQHILFGSSATMTFPQILIIMIGAGVNVRSSMHLTIRAISG